MVGAAAAAAAAVAVAVVAAAAVVATQIMQIALVRFLRQFTNHSNNNCTYRRWFRKSRWKTLPSSLGQMINNRLPRLHNAMKTILHLRQNLIVRQHSIHK
jgi:hypothetical protein